MRKIPKKTLLEQAMRRRSLVKTIVTGFPDITKECLIFAGVLVVFHGAGILAITECAIDIICVSMGKRAYVYFVAIYIEAQTLMGSSELVSERLAEEIPAIERFLS